MYKRVVPIPRGWCVHPMGGAWIRGKALAVCRVLVRIKREQQSAKNKSISLMQQIKAWWSRWYQKWSERKTRIAYGLMVEGIEYADAKKVTQALQWGVDPNARYGTMFWSRRGNDQLDSMTLVERCARIGNVSAIEQLVAFGATVVPSDWDQMVADHSGPLQDEQSVEALRAAFSASQIHNTEGSGRWLALHHAVAKGHLETVAFLSTLTPSGVNAKTKNGWTPLWIAIREQRYEVVQWLLQNGADPNAKIAGTPLLVSCAYKKDERALTLLLQSGADVNITDTKKATALHALAQIRAPNELVLLLLEYGARLDLRCAYGKTPVGRAVSENSYRLSALMEQYALEHQVPMGQVPCVQTDGDDKGRQKAGASVRRL